MLTALRQVRHWKDVMAQVGTLQLSCLDTVYCIVTA